MQDTPWKKARKLKASQWILLIRALVVLLLIKVGLKVFSFKQFKKLFARVTNHRNKIIHSEKHIQQVAWAVRTVAHVLPVSLVCLPQALAVKYLLRHEPDLPLHIGVQQSARAGFEAHAWVERAGQIVIGAWPEGETYRPLWVWS